MVLSRLQRYLAADRYRLCWRAPRGCVWSPAGHAHGPSSAIRLL